MAMELRLRIEKVMRLIEENELWDERMITRPYVPLWLSVQPSE